jgi:MoxR-like ATPase
MVRLSVGYPLPEDEDEILRLRSERGTDGVDIRPVITPETFLAMRAAIENVYVHPDVRRYIVDLVAKTRQHRQVVVGASPRASISLLKLSKAWAAIHGREYVVPDDIRPFVQPVLAHRIVLDPALWEVRTSDRAVVEDVVRAVPVPVLPEK